MILSIDFNPSLTRRYILQNFQIGKDYIAYDMKYSPGGWGLDLAKIVKAFNEPVKVTGFLAGRNGEHILELLNLMNMKSDFIAIEGESRTTTKIISDYGIETEISERPPSLSNSDVVRFYQSYQETIREADIICGSGCLAIPPDMYRDLITMANKEKKLFLLEASAEVLKHSSNQAPFCISIPKDELEEYMGFMMTNEGDIVKSCNYILENGSKIVIVHLKPQEFILVYDEGFYRIRTPDLNIMNTRGIGSAILAGLAISILRNYDFEYMIRIAIACGLASAVEKDTGIIDMGNMKNIANKIEIEKSLVY